MKLFAVIVALEAIASAQPQPDVEPPPVDPPVAPAEPVAPAVPAAPPPVAPTPPPGHDMAVRMTNAARNAAANGTCGSIGSLEARVRDLDPAYHDQVFATDATIARCRPAAVAASAEPTPRRVGRTFELGIGGGEVGDEGGAVSAVGGPAIGVGGFVTPHVALSLRVAGATVASGGLVYVGTLGPNAQLWLGDNAWIGGGLGMGFLVGCGPACHAVGLGADARLGYAFRPRGESGVNLAIEATLESFGPEAAERTISLMLGYQTF
jgi:hypothetical protein